MSELYASSLAQQIIATKKIIEPKIPDDVSIFMVLIKKKIEHIFLNTFSTTFCTVFPDNLKSQHKNSGASGGQVPLFRVCCPVE